MKKTISIILCIIMTVSLLSTAAFAQGLTNFQKSFTYTQGKFTDVASTDWFSMNVEAAYEYGLMNGRTTSTFGASDNVKLSEVIALAARLRSIYMTGSTDFKTGSPWYQSYLSYCISNQIISSGDYSNYDAYATRYQFAEILAASLPSAALTQINTINVGDIPDVPLTGAYQSIYTLYRAGIITGKTTAGEFCPSDYILRSETAAIVTRMANEVLRMQFTIVKAGSTNINTQLRSTVNAARDEMSSALEYYTDAYSKSTNSYFSSAATQLEKATTFLQMAALYSKSAAEICKASGSYSASYDNLNSTYQKCMAAISDISVLTAASCETSADWSSARTLMNDCANLLLTAYNTIG